MSTFNFDVMDDDQLISLWLCLNLAITNIKKGYEKDYPVVNKFIDTTMFRDAHFPLWTEVDAEASRRGISVIQMTKKVVNTSIISII
jgi:hypothetical protein